MLSLLKYGLRYILTICIITAIAFVMACTILAVYLAVKCGTKFRKICEHKKKK